MGSPPDAGMKKWVPKFRSMVSSMRPTVITGKASTSRMEVIRVIQMNTGIRIRLMPGARRLMIVTMKLKPAANDEIPSTCNPRPQKSKPLLALKGFSVRLAYENQPASGAWFIRKLECISRAPNRNTQ